MIMIRERKRQDNQRKKEEDLMIAFVRDVVRHNTQSDIDIDRGYKDC